MYIVCYNSDINIYSGGDVMSVLSDLLLVVISLVGFGYIVSGKPKSKRVRYVNRYGDEVFYKTPNFTKRIINLFLIILVLYFLGSMVK